MSEKMGNPFERYNNQINGVGEHYEEKRHTLYQKYMLTTLKGLSHDEIIDLINAFEQRHGDLKRYSTDILASAKEMFDYIQRVINVSQRFSELATISNMKGIQREGIELLDRIKARHMEG